MPPETSPADAIVDLYERNAQAWCEDRGPALHEPYEPDWMGRFMRMLPAGGSILDIGCGSGEPVAHHLTANGFKVTGIDSAPSLIEIAASRTPPAGAPASEWLVGDMRGLHLGRRLDGLLAWHSFFHLTPDDQRPMFARFAAHAREGAALMFTSGPRHGDLVGSWRGEPLYHGSLDPEEYRHLLNANGFGVADHRIGQPIGVGPTIWLARFRS